MELSLKESVRKQKCYTNDHSFMHAIKYTNWIATGKRMKLDHYLMLPTAINSNWVKNFNVRPKTVQLLEENVGGKLLDIGLRHDFFNMTPKAKAIKAKINKSNYIKLKSFCTAKETINKMKSQPTELEKIFGKWAEDLNRHFFK